jgi:enoyl-CoA hydratase/carnithine racemase
VPGVNIGFWCHTPQVQLTRVVGRKQAMMMLATGKLFSADHALSIGLVNEVVDLDALDARVDGLAAEIASKSGHTLAAGKASFHRQLALDVPAAYALVRDLAVKHLEHRDAKEGIAAFLEKRPAAWDQD